MSDPVTMCFEIPEGCPPDIELMTIWVAALERYKAKVSDPQLRAAAFWLNDHVKNATAEN